MGKLILRLMYDTEFEELETALDDLEGRFAESNITAENEFWENFVLIKNDEDNEQEDLNVIYQELILLKESYENYNEINGKINYQRLINSIDLLNKWR